MKKKFTIYLWILIFIPFSGHSIAQTLTIFSSDTKNYPDIKTEFKLRDKNSREVRNFNINDLEVKENGIPRLIKSVSCGPQDISKFSAILTIDVSGSMDSLIDYSIPGQKTRMEVAQSAAIHFINALPVGRFECAITSFSYGNTNDFPSTRLINKFTTDKDDLIYGVGTLRPLGGTDYNSGLLRQVIDDVVNPGSLEVAKSAKFKPIIIFLTDGNHKPENGGPFRYYDVLEEAKALDASVYCLTLGLPMPEELKTISDQTGGLWFSGQTNEDQIKEIYLTILNDASNKGLYPPCEVVWETNCDGGSNVVINVKGENASTSTTNFDIPDSVKPVLDINPRNLSFINVAPSTNKEINVAITAKNNFVNVSGFSPSDARFIVSDWGGSPPPFKLVKDATRTIKIKYSSSDSLYLPALLSIDGSACEGSTLTPNAEWLIAKDIDMGPSVLDVPKQLPMAAFHNLSGTGITINKIYLKDGDIGDFEIISQKTNIPLGHNMFANVDFQFKPTSVGPRQTTFYVETNKGTFTSKLTGMGTGEAGLTSVSSVNFSNTNCLKPYKDTTILIKNTGTLPLEIKDFAIDGTSKMDFVFNPAPVKPMKIAKDSTDSVKIRFMPLSGGLKSAVLRVISNSKENPEYDIQLGGESDSINYVITGNKDELVFGVLCPGESKELTIDLVNTGSVPFAVTANVSGSFSSSSAKYDLIPSSLLTAVISFSSDSEGTYSEELIFRDTICNIEKKITLKAIVEAPKIICPDIDFVSTVGVQVDRTISIQNPTGRDITINNYNLSDPQFYVAVPPLPWQIPAYGSIDVILVYNPDKDEETSATLELDGDPCGFSANINLSGQPSMATADLSVAHYEGLIDQIIEIPVNLVNRRRIQESGINALNWQISFDDDVLETVSPTPTGTLAGGRRIIDINGAAVAGNSDNGVFSLFVKAKQSTKTTTDIKVSQPEPVGGMAIITPISGEFEVKVASADISAGTDISSSQFSAYVGHNFTIPIKISNAVNVASFHEGIGLTIEFNASLLEPVGNTPKGRIEGEKRIIDIGKLSLESLNQDSILASYEFKALLGSSAETDILINQAHALKGIIDINAKPAKFTLGYVCREGGDRLFNPWGNAGLLSITPNPANESVRVDFETSETGTTELKITDIFGETYRINSAGNYKPGLHNYSFDISDMPAGIYFITLQTPTQIFNQTVHIVR